MPEAPVLPFRDVAAFERWLEKHVCDEAGVWLKLAKKESGIPSLTSDEAVDVGLCFGWISGQRKPLDEKYYLQKYVPRRKRSRWSQVNVDKVAQLTKAGRMRPSGIAEVDAAKADGRWHAAYESQRNSRVPPELANALRKNSKAKKKFESLGKTERYAVILKIVTARDRELQVKRAIDSLE